MLSFIKFSQINTSNGAFFLWDINRSTYDALKMIINSSSLLLPTGVYFPLCPTQCSLAATIFAALRSSKVRQGEKHIDRGPANNPLGTRLVGKVILDNPADPATKRLQPHNEPKERSRTRTQVSQDQYAHPQNQTHTKTWLLF